MSMKKIMIVLAAAALLLSSCGSYEATGAYTGSQFGHVLGSAIGGLAGGWRGHELGSIVGTVGGAAVGAAIGRSADRRQEERVAERQQARRAQQARQRQAAAAASGQYDNGQYGNSQYGNAQYGNGQYDNSGYDPQMQGDDRISFDPVDGFNSTGTTDSYAGTSQLPTLRQGYAATSGPALVVRNAGVYEDQRDGVLTRGEAAKVIFEIVNTSSQPVYDVFPLVEEATGNKHVHISPNLRIESIAPHQAVRYTASLVADRGLRNGQIAVRVGVAQGNSVISSQTRQFTVNTAKRAATARR